ncbi:MAG: DUF3465 domain-containing protein [Proteobacteria bacterium]|nr:DUF3465 domain-containing protein [Pseudomonadota bacterium]
MKKLLIILFLGFALYGLYEKNPGFIQSFTALSTASDQLLQRAYENRQSNFQVGGSGVVIKILPDDLQGNRHQKFILRLSSGQTLLIAHNIDIAPRIDTLRERDTVEFLGEYEWNAKGGVVHWTHHDPAGRHSSGWLKHNGFTYQ